VCVWREKGEQIMLSKTLRKAVDSGAWRLPQRLPYLLSFFPRCRKKKIFNPPETRLAPSDFNTRCDFTRYDTQARWR